jgi:hypothetical protein
MKTTHSCLSRICTFAALVTGFAGAPSVPAAIVTNWVAYNDHRPGPTIPPHTPTATSWGTRLRVTTYNMGAPADTVGAVLTNFYNGQALPVTMSVIRTGGPDDFGTITVPGTNTPAGSLFFGVVDLSNIGIVGVDAGIPDGADMGVDWLTFTFSGLNPNKRYVFRGSSCRGGGYGTRWSVATITNMNGFIDAHINGVGTDPNSRVLTVNDFPADLRPGQAAWNSGDNVEGAVVGWDFIAPSDDGSFSIVVEQYTNHISATSLANDVKYGYSFGAILLAEVEASPPVITTHPPPQTTVEQNRPFSLSVSASGTPLLYQWYKEGLGAISGATLATYSVSLAAVSDSGNYYVVVYNPLARATSTVAHVTVNADVTAPSVLSAFSFPTFDPSSQVATLDHLTVEFNEAVRGNSVSNPAQYNISGIGTPTSATFTNDRSVILTLPTALAEDTAYTVQVSGAIDLAGNTAGSTTAPFRSWMRGAGNSLLYEYYNTGAGVDVAVLTNHASFPNNPTFRTNLWAFDTRVVFPDDSQGGYGSRVSGVFIPPFSGDWVFFIRAWDRGAVFFNPNGMDPAGRREILAEVTGNNPRDWNKFTSTAFRLQGGQGYYIESLQQADLGTGTDVIKVAARPSGTGFPGLGVPDIQLDTNSVLMGGYIGSPLAPRDLGGSLTIPAGQPADVNTEENHIAVFSVQVSNPSRAPLQYQWYRDGSPIPGATGPSYSLQVTTADSGHTYRVRIAKVGSEVTSRTASLTVRPDTTPPRALSVTSSYADLTTIVVNFDEPINQADLQEPFDYRLDGSPPSTAAPGVNGMSAILTFSTPLVQGSQHTLEVVDVRDLVGLTISPNPTSLSFRAGESDIPRLNITLDVNDATLSWPAPSTGFVLEEATTLSPPDWTAVAGTPAVIGVNNVMTVTRAAGMRLYRLRN